MKGGMNQMSVNYKVVIEFYAVFDDGSRIKLLDNVGDMYYFWEQQYKYLLLSLQQKIEELGITARPIRFEQVDKIVECESYEISIGL